MRVKLLIAVAGCVLWGAGVVLSFPDPNDEGSPPQPTAGRIIEALATTESSPADAPPLIVHEWGTFTSFSGSDGVKLEYRPLADNDLPAFVSNRLNLPGFLFLKRTIPSIQRMETPVTYFYTPVERDVSVRVDFPDGLLTEFYPPVRESGPPIDLSSWTDLTDQSQVRTAVPLENSMLDWGTVHLIPTESLRARVEDDELSRRIGRHVERMMLPDAGGFAHHAAARDTDSAIVQFRAASTDESGMIVSATDYFEKFLFYRGVGNFELPLTLEASGDGEFVLTNDGPDSVRSLFLVTVRGEELWFSRAAAVAGHSRLTMRQPDSLSTIDELTAQVVDALRDEGLYEKEAWSMVNTWKESWFGEEGTRLFYMLPQRVTDVLLPLRVEPVPDETIRVLVGRMEIMSPSDEQRILELVATSAAARTSHSESGSEEPFVSPVLGDLLALGRLAEPALARARGIAAESELRDEASSLLADLRNLEESAESVAASP